MLPVPDCDPEPTLMVSLLTANQTDHRGRYGRLMIFRQKRIYGFITVGLRNTSSGFSSPIRPSINESQMLPKPENEARQQL